MNMCNRSGARAIGIAACALAMLAAPGRAQQGRAHRAPACQRYAIGPVRQVVDSLRRPVYVEFPSVVKAGDKLTLFSNVTVLWRSEKVYADTVGLIDDAKAGRYIDSDTLAGVTIDTRGRASTFGKPRGFRRMTAMVAASDGRDGAWVTWLTAPDSSKPPYDLWVAHYRAGRWEQVEHLLHAAFISQYSLSISEPGPNSSPLIGLVGDATGASDGSRGIGVYRREHGQWRPSWIATGDNLPITARIGRQDDGRVIVAYTGALRKLPARVDTNEVWIAQSGDGGATWSDFRSIEKNWNYRTNWLDLQVYDRDHVHLLWMIDHPGDGNAALVHLSTTDGGTTWHRSHQTSHRQLKSVTSIATRRGLTFIARDVLDSLALVELRTNEPPAVQHLEWQDRTLPPRATTLGDKSGSAIVVWSSLISNAYPLFPGFPVPASSYAWLKPCVR